KKGLLFYGPPGTGKSHTIRYIASSLPKHTTLLVTAAQVALIADYMALSRLLSPAIVVIEDVDLIARDREDLKTPGQESLLNRLLNEMDGLRENSEVLFILTTNRPETLEPALAGRPGRVDQAIEFPLPDDEARRRLVELYRHGLTLPEAVTNDLVARTEGVSAAFIKEMMRRTAQFTLERSGASDATAADVESALAELLFEGGSLNAKLLGAARSPGA
ncbi:MAG TPA: ATP-binding protein, partial [Polyangiaceae bacterium]